MLSMPVSKKLLAATLSSAVILDSTLNAAEAAVSSSFNSPATSVQMFLWRWSDLARECSTMLGPAGYGAVQISPPQASKLTGTWWGVYQPVNFRSLTSPMGTEAQLKSMIDACHAAGVRVYADIVTNQMAGDSSGSFKSSDGSSWNAADLSYPQFSPFDFNEPCTIVEQDYSSNRNNVINCRLNQLPDLETTSTYVQGIISTYMKKLLALGIDGFRIDAAKHQNASAWATIISTVKSAYPTTLAGETIWITQEIIPDGTVKRADYYKNGTVNEFNYAVALKETFRNENGQAIAALPSIMGLPGNWGGNWNLIPSKSATVFVNNWDTERTPEASLNASNASRNDQYMTRRYTLANIFMLAWPYGEAQVHSGYYFSNKDADAPRSSPFDANGNPVTTEWDFIHRWAAVASMVKFRSATEGEGVSNWVTGNENQIAFSRGQSGFVAINNANSVWTKTFQTGLPAGTYCNIVRSGSPSSNTCAEGSVTVSATGTATLTLPANNGSQVPAVAIYPGSRL